MFKKSNIPQKLIAQFITQLFYYINAHTVNTLLSTNKFCTMGSALQLKMSITQLEVWCQNNQYSDSKYNYFEIILI